MTDPRLALIRDPRFREHSAPGGHLERAARLDAIDQALAPLSGQFDELEPRPASDEEILRAHEPAYVATLRGIEGQSAQLDPDTYASARSVEVARLAAGSTVELALRVARGELGVGFALVRPPGHHAEADRAMGFCLLNQVGIAAHAVRADAGVERVAIVDFDVHHGNGTQHMFEEERDVLFISTHQFPFYPGTGALAERGKRAGEGSTVNLPLPAGSGDSEYAAAFDATLVPVLQRFNPDLILVSAGFDAAARDPLASMQVSTEGFARMAAVLRTIADDVCDGRMVLSLEGGYDLPALGAAVHAVVNTLAAPKVEIPAAPAPTPLASELTALYREAHL